ncbi:MAG: DUF4097 family beta strand repeat-containing protein [Pyrinomonadaceae bacterium]
MKHNILGILLVSVMILAGAEQSIRQFHGLKCAVQNWAQSGLWSCLQTVQAEGRKSTKAAVSAALSGGQTSQDDFRWQGRIAQGNAIEIKGVNGGIRAEGSTGSEVEVVAVKKSRRSDPNSVRIQVVEHGNGVTICAVYPSSDSKRPNVCGAGDEGHNSVQNNDVQVEFVVRVPAGVRFSGHTVNGGVEATSLGADVEASTVNGSVHISTTGYAEASTVNGEIVASFGRADWTRPLEFETVNGSITLNLPATTSTRLEAETLNGDITTDFSMTVQGRFSKRHVTGTIGDGGGRDLSLKTVNGSIQVRRAG